MLTGALPSAAANAIVYQADGTLDVAYYDSTAHNLKFSQQSLNGSWSTPTIIDNSSSDVGKYVSIAINGKGFPAVAYQDSANADLKFAQYNGSSWSVTTVDKRKTTGFNPSLTFDSAGNGYISYYKANSGDLELATQKTGKWTLTTLVTAGNVGLYSSIAINPTTGKPSIAYSNLSGKVQFIAGSGKTFTKPVTVGSVTNIGTVSLAFSGATAAVGYVDPSTGNINLGQLSGKTFTNTTIATVAANSDAGAQVLIDPTTLKPDVVYHDSAGVYVADSAAQGSGFSVTQVSTGGQNTIATVQPGSGTVVFSSVNSTGGTLSVNSTTTPPAAPSNVAALGNSPTTATITWTDNSNNEAGFLIERSTDGANFTTAGTTAPNTTGFSDTGLTEGTTYYYRVSAIGAAGNNVAGTTVAAATLATTTTFPAPATIQTAAATTSTTATVTWQNNSHLLIGFIINRSTDGGATWTLAGYAGAGSTSFSDTGLTEGTSYTYEVIAYNGVGGTPSSALTTETAPSAPDTFTANTASTTSVALSWNNTSRAQTGFTIARTTGGSGPVTTINVGPNVSSYLDNNLTEATVYSYTIYATGANSTISAASPTISAVTNPLAPSQFTAVAQSSSRINLSWHNNSSGATGYILQRSTNGGAYATIAPISGAGTTTYPDQGLSEGVTYSYQVESVDGTSVSGFSAPVQSTTLPAAPTVLNATASGTSVTLTWQDNSTSETNFVIQRSSTGGAPWTTILAPSNSTGNATYIDNGVSNGLTYTYQVSAKNTAGTSSATNQQVVTIVPAAPTGLTATGASSTAINLSWSPDPVGETGIYIERFDGTTWSYVTTTGASATSYQDTTNLTPGTTYQYRISAINNGHGAGTSGYSSATGVTAPATPAPATATVASSSEIDLSWSPVTGATSYIVTRTGGGATTALPSVTTTTYPDTGLTEGTAYSYTITAVNAGGSSTASTAVSATTLPAAPTGVVASPITATTVSISWSNVSQGATSVTVQKSTSLNGTYTLVANATLNQQSVIDYNAVEGTTYYYEVVATDAGGSSAAIAQPITTVPAAPTGLTTTANSDGTVTLQWTNNSQNATSYTIERGTDSANFPWTTTVSNVTNSYTDTPPNSATTYYYQVYATGTGGPSDYSNPASATTVPAVPQNVTATATSATTVSVNWNSVSGATGYNILRSTNGGQYLQYDTSITNSYSDSGAAEATEYSYEIQATNGVVSAASTASAPVTTAPSAPGSVAVTSVTAGAVSLSWANTSQASVSDYEIIRTGGGQTETFDLHSGSQTTYTDSTVTEGSTYLYQIFAEATGGTSASSLIVKANTNPAAPTAVTATENSATSVTISWNNVSTNATGYDISRDGNVVFTTSGSTDSYTDTVSEDGSYQYQVRATQLLSDGITTIRSPWVSAQTVTTPPASPTNVIATATDASDVAVTWTNNSPTASQFQVERFDGTTLATFTPVTAITGTNTYTDSTAVDGAQYTYSVIAIGANGSSAPVAASAVTTYPPIPSILTATNTANPQVTITWGDVPAETGFNVERNDGSGWSDPIAIGQGVTTYTDTTSVEDVNYQYRVQAVNSSGSSAFSTPVSVSTFLAAPTDVTITHTTSGEIDLSWTDHSNAATGYEVDSSSDGGINWLNLTTPTPLGSTATSYQDTSVSDGTTYIYQVRALSTAGNSNFVQSGSTTTPVIAPTGLTATAVSTTQVDLSWTSSSATANSYQIWRGIGDATPTYFDTTTSTTYSDTTLSPGETVSYYIIASNTNIQSATSVASTPAIGTTTSSAPTNLDVEPVSTDSLSVTWDNATGATSYLVYRGSGSDPTYYATVTPTDGATTTFTDSGLSDGTTYQYQVFAYNSGGLSVGSDIAENTTNLAPPTNLTVASETASSVTLHWTDNTSNADGYVVEQNGTPIQDSFNLTANAASYTVTGLSEATQYSFQVYAFGANGPSITTNTITPTTLPAAPTLTSAVAEADGVHVAWTDNSSNSSNGFVVQRIGNGGSDTQNFDVAAGLSSYVDTTATPNTQYAYQVLASGVGGNSAPSTYTNVLTLPATPTNITASSTTSSSVTLTWTPDTNGAAGGYTILRFSGNTPTTAGSAASNASTFTDTGATAGGTYTYEIIATNNGGNAAPLTSSPVSVLTAAPSGLTATAITDSSITLNWSDVAGETGFVLQRSLNGTSNWQTLPAISQGATSYTDSTNVAEGTQYYYQIAGTDGSGTGDYSASLGVLTIPAGPTALTATPISATQVNLAWTDHSQNESGYIVTRTPLNGSPTILTDTLPAGTESYQDTSASAGVTYTYQVVAFNDTGSSTAATQTAVTIPGQPQSLAAVSSTSTTMDLSWNSVFGATSYTVSRSPNGSTDWTLFTPVTTNSYHDTGLTEGTNYYYSITANDSQGPGQAATVSAPTVPAPIISLSISSSSATQITLNWVDNSVGATGYDVYRETNNSGNFGTPYVITDPTITTFSQSVTEGTTYTYRVTPVDASGEGAATDISITTVPATPTLVSATPASDTTVNLIWANNSASATGFNVYRAPVNSSNWTELTNTPLASTATTFADTSLSGGTAYQYKVVAQGLGGPSADSNLIDATTYPSAVTTMYTTVVSTTQLQLNWSPVNGATGYDILRGSSPSNLAQFDTVGQNASSYEDTNLGTYLTEGTTYYYQVLATNGTGSSAAGNTASATTLPLAPSGLSLTVVSNDQIHLSWTNNSTNQEYVDIEKLEGQSWVQIALTSDSTTSTYDDSTLTGGTSYSYRIASVSLGGSSYMTDHASVTALTDPDAPTLTAIPAIDGTIGLSWTTPNTATTYTVERSTGGGGWSPVVTATSQTSTTDSGLAGNTTYQYQILASNGSGSGPYGSPISALTVPDAPSSLVATAASTSAVNLAWTGDAGANVKFTVYRAAVTSGVAGQYTKIGSVTGSTTYTDSTGLSAGTTYAYEVVASNASGPSVTPALSNQVATYPVAPASLARTILSTPAVDLTWTASTGATSYTVSRIAAGDMSYTLLTGSALASNATSYNDTTALPGISYTYEVTAINASGSNSSTIAALTYPANPTGLSVTATDNHDILVQWNAVTGASSYTLQRQINGGNWTNVSGVSGTSVTDVVAGGATYAYQVLATNATGSSAYVTTGSVTTVPDAPTGVTATASSDVAVQISWTLSSGATGYIVERSETGSAPYTFSSATLGSNITTYNDGSLSEMTPYTYVVVAVDGGGNSAVSTAVPVVTLPTAPTNLATTAVSASEVDLSWTDNSNGLAGFDVQRNDGLGAGWVTLHTTAAGITTYSDTTVSSATSYQYRVIADNGSVASVPTSALTVLTLPATVSGLTATANGTTEIDLNWTADTGTITHYRVMESTGGSFTEVGTDLGPDVTSAQVTGLTPGGSYQFEVLAVNGTGVSLVSSGFLGQYWENTQVRPDLIPSSTPPTFTQTDQTIDIGSDSFEGTAGMGSVPGAPNGFGTSDFVSQWTGVVQPRYSEQYTFYATSDDGIRILVNGVVIGTDNFNTSRGQSTDSDVVPYAFVAGESYNIEVQFRQGGGGWDARLEWSSASQAREFVHPTTIVTASTLPNAPTGFTATPANATTVNFAWVDSSGATSYTIMREGPNDDGYQPLDGASDIQPGVQAYQDSTALPGTNYSYEILANDAAGSSTAATQSILTVPAAVTLDTPTVVSDSEIDLSWTDDTGTVNGYDVYVYNPNTTQFDLLTSTPLANTVNTYDVTTGLTEGTSYTFEVLAHNSEGFSGNSDTNPLNTYFKTPDVAATATTNSSVTLTWTNHSAVDTGYEVDELENGVWTSVDSSAAITVNGTTGSYTVTGLTEATNYTFRVEATGASSTTSIPQEVSASTAPNDPTNLTATSISTNSIGLSWTNNSLNADSIIVERSPAGQNSWTTIDTLAGNATSDTDTTNLTEATAYDYRIVATKGSSSSNFDTYSSVTTRPLAPTAVTPTVVSATEVTLSWTDVSANATGYRVYRSSSQNAGYVQIGSDLTSGTAHTYDDTSAPENATSYYIVVAYDAGGESTQTATTSATTPLAAPTNVVAATTSNVTTGDKTVVITWTNVSTVATGINVERSNGDSWTLLTSSPLTPSTATYSDDTAAENTAYTYRVWATDDSNSVDSTHTVSGSVTTLLSAPTSLALTAKTDTSITLTWSDVSVAATSYHVERSLNGVNFSDVGAVLSGTATTYTDTGLSDDTQYYYQVRAETGSNTSNASSIQSLTTSPSAPTTLTATPFSTTEIDLHWVDVSTTATQYTVEEFDGTNWNVVTSALNGSATSADVTGLIEATDHQYEVFATGAGGNSAVSNSVTATTVPLAPSTPTLTSNSASSVTIGWTDNSAGATSVQVQRLTGGVWSTLPSNLSGTDTTFTDSTVSEATSYEYRLAAVRNGVDSAYSSPLSVTTVPAAPSNLAVTSSTSTHVSLSWSNNSSGQTGFVIERTGGLGGLTTVATPSAGSTTFTDNAIVEGTSYTYYIYATGTGGNSANSGTVTANIAPAAPSALTATSVTPTSVALSWTNNSAHATGFYVQAAYNGSGTFTTIATVTSGTTYTDSTVTEDNAYQYRVQAYGTTGTSAFSTSVSVNTPLLAPTDLTATTASAGQINLSWTINSQNEAGVLLERQTGGGSWTQISLPAGTSSYQDTGVAEATNYVYQVENTATDSSVNSSFSSTSTATTLPAAPSGVTGTAASDTQVTVAWTNNSSGATGFTIQRFTAGTGWVSAGSVNGSTTSFLDSGLTELTAYSYRVLATGAGGNSTWATSASSVTTLPAAPSNFSITAPIASRISLTWTDNSLGATGYQIYRNGSLLTTLESGATSYNDNTVIESTAYTYKVRTVSNALFSVYTPTQTLTTVPAAPNTLAASAASTTAINLTWNDVSTGATAYLVERSDDLGNTWTQIASLGAGANSYTSSGLTEGTEYQYRVRAYGVGGNSGYSATVDGTTLPATPSGLTATPSSGVIALTWTDNSNGETSYTVQRSTGSGWTTIATLAADSQSFNDVGSVGGLVSSQNYQYQVFCTDAGGNSAVISASATAV